MMSNDDGIGTGGTLASGARRTLLCADDYGLSEGVSRGVFELAATGKLSALSAMTTTPAWSSCAGALGEIRPRVSIGLHLDLSAGLPLANSSPRRADGRFQPLGTALRRSLTGRWDRRALAAEIDAQLDAFEAGTGAAPDHIDGHRHVHVLPGVRETFLERLLVRYPDALPLVRDPTATSGGAMDRRAALKSRLIAALGAGFARAAIRSGCPINDSFAGFSSFSAERSFESELAHALERGRGLQIVMCHPGYADREIARWDSLVERREEERSALAGMTVGPWLWRPVRDPADGRIEWGSAVGAAR